MIKRWTVILIPHDRGQRRSFSLSNLHLWAVLSLVAVLALTTAFFYRRSETHSAAATRLETRYRHLEAILEGQNVPADLEGHLARKEAEIRALYEARDKAMTDELSRLYDLEREVRIVSNLPASPVATGQVPRAGAEGQGGMPGGSDTGIVYEDGENMNPPALIYGVANPSADLILEEMNLRLKSLNRLVNEMQAQRHLVDHTPVGWPTNSAKRRVNSRFGVRSDPFTHELRQHSGVDISAEYGSPVFATADGVVTFSGYHQYLGHLVKINHGYRTETWYGHMSKRLVQKGEVVHSGDTVGTVGSTGRSTGPHIHYEVHVNGGWADPRNYIGK